VRPFRCFGARRDARPTLVLLNGHNACAARREESHPRSGRNVSWTKSVTRHVIYLNRMPPPLDLERLYDEHAQAVYAFLINLTRNEPDTRDLLQELFTKLVRRPELLDGVANERPFLLRLAHNAAIDLARRRMAQEKNWERLVSEADSAFAVSDDPDEEAFRQALTEALGELPAEQRAVVHLKLWEGLTFDAIAGPTPPPAAIAMAWTNYASGCVLFTKKSNEA
jgi:RNA polymerase sigma-70 factor, ECF subfamily